MAASAAGMALLWNGSGRFFHTMRTSFGYSLATCVSVGSTRPQNGHWKSDHMTMVTLDVLGPRAGEWPTSALYTVFASGSPGRAAGVGGAAALSRPALVSSAYRS